jgi:spermidine/putrescine transport system permease protein
MKHGSLFKQASIGFIWIWLTAFALVPSIMVLMASVLERGESEFIAFSFTAKNYFRIFDPLYWHVFWSSITLASLTTVLCLVFGYPFAYLLARSRSRYRQILLLLVIIPFWTSSLIRTYAMIVILKTKGILNNALLGAGLIDRPLAILYTDTAVLIGLAYSLLPFMVLPLYSSIEKLDIRIIEAAGDLGANRAMTFAKIIVPLTMPGIVAGSMLVFLPALGMFYIPDMLGGARTLLVGNLIRNQFLSARDWPFGSAVSVVLTVVMALMLLVYYRSVRMTHRGEPL